MSKPLPNSKALYRLGVRGRASLLEGRAVHLKEEISSMLQAGSHWRMVDNVRRRLRRVYKAADRFGHYVGQPSTGVTSPAYMRLLEGAIRRYPLVDMPVNHHDDPADKPRIRVKAISRHTCTDIAA
ncbi:hypothetical protein LB518_24335 [Mesorhizobium sp. BR1-1-16]|uniref:hypothetical protein n=1 Tax=Mesorhizobium sp. BR1-1-16 TaxID=2876653 RepID=UPI001CCD1ED4|nr:hypothetical protein [Mesorhizobium sp. BR1-1-16]MBZ9939437.1 hypothetical protein [Mesorhizobium sp. BR1-1-16]